MKREPNSIALAFFMPLFCLLLSTSFILRLRLKGPKSTGLLATTCGTAGRREQPFALTFGPLRLSPNRAPLGRGSFFAGTQRN